MSEGVIFYDDSKATNVGAVLAGLDGFERPFVLICGGRAKQGDDGKFIKLAVVDAAKQPTGEPWNGDKVRVAFKLGGWTSPFGAGIKPYLSAVQVIERRPKNSGGFNAVNVFDDPAEDTEIPF